MRLPDRFFERGYGNEIRREFISLKLRYIFLIVGLFIAAMGSGVEALEMVSCHKAAEKVGVTGHYSIWTKCYYRLPDGRYTPQENYPPKYIHVEGRKHG